MTLLVLLAAVGGALYWGYRVVVGELRDFASAAPLEIERTPNPDGAKSARDAVEKVAELASEPGPAETVSLPVADLDALLGEEIAANKIELPGPIKLAAEGDELIVDLSWPLDELRVSELQGKYLSGTVRAAVSYSEGALHIDIRDGTSPDGRKLPERLSMLVSKALSEFVERKYSDRLANVESAEIKDGRVEFRLAEREATGAAKTGD
jgi:hypothetical protein